MNTRTNAPKALILLALPLILGILGCDPDKDFQKGKYAEAYPEFVKRGGQNEAVLRNEVANGNFATRNNAGNQAIHDYYYAAESQKRLGNPDTAKLYYQKAVDLSSFSIRIPQDKSAIVKDKFQSLEMAIRNFRSQEMMLSNRETDPYDSNGNRVNPEDDWSYRMYYNNITTYRQEFERALYSTTAQDMPDIENVKKEYERFSRNLDSYLMFAAPGGMLRSPNSLGSAIMYGLLEGSMTSFSRAVFGAQGIVTYITSPIQLKEPQLVSAAQTALGSMAQTSGSPASSSVNLEKSGEY